MQKSENIINNNRFQCKLRVKNYDAILQILLHEQRRLNMRIGIGVDADRGSSIQCQLGRDNS